MKGGSKANDNCVTARDPNREPTRRGRPLDRRCAERRLLRLGRHPTPGLAPLTRASALRHQGTTTEQGRGGLAHLPDGDVDRVQPLLQEHGAQRRGARHAQVREGFLRQPDGHQHPGLYQAGV